MEGAGKGNEGGTGRGPPRILADRRPCPDPHGRRGKPLLHIPSRRPCAGRFGSTIQNLVMPPLRMFTTDRCLWCFAQRRSSAAAAAEPAVEKFSGQLFTPVTSRIHVQVAGDT
jgi:hypothetical protein